MKIIVNHYNDNKNIENSYSSFTVFKTGKTYIYHTGDKMPEAFWYLVKCLNNGYEISNKIIMENGIDKRFTFTSAIYKTY